MSGPVDNSTLRAAVVAFGAAPNDSTYIEVLRCCLQGQVLFDTTGSTRPVVAADGTARFEKGAVLRFAGGLGADDQPALFAFTSQAEVLRMHEDAPDDVQTLVQTAPSVLEFLVSQEYAWLYIDPAGPTCAISKADAEHALRGERNDAVKEALQSGDRGAVLDALARGDILNLAVEGSDPQRTRVRSTQGPDGSDMLLAFTSGPEVSARNTTDGYAAVAIERVLRDALAAPYSGLVLNPAGPWMALDHDDLTAVLARITG